MSKNRKKSETFRFNGVFGMTPVKVDVLEAWIAQFEAKLADPNDPDDKKWTQRWLERFQKEMRKKEDAIKRRQLEVEKRNRPSVADFE